MIVEINCIPNAINPKAREQRMRVAFAAEAVILVREILSIGVKEDGKHTKIVFRGDTYEHHAIETDVAYDDVLKLIGWKT